MIKRKPWTLRRLKALIRMKPPGKCKFCNEGTLTDKVTGIKVSCPICHELGGSSA